jgi:hypothetical protein
MNGTNTVNGTNDCIGYINKLKAFGANYAPAKLFISASAANYANTNFVLDGIRGQGYADPGRSTIVSSGMYGLIASGASSNEIIYIDGVETNGIPSNVAHPTGISNVAGYMTWGAHSSLGPVYATDGKVQWKGSSGWWIIETVESFNGRIYETDMASFVGWFSANAFGGTNYSNTPVAAVSHTDEPGVPSSARIYFGLWASGNNFAICAWNSLSTSNFQAVGDPFVKR